MLRNESSFVLSTRNFFLYESMFRKWRKSNVFELKLMEKTKIYNREKLKDQNKSNFS